MFKMISALDHFSLKTGLTPVVNLSKAGAAFASAGGVITEVANGWYKIALTTTDSNTLGDLAYYITAALADDTDFCDQVSTLIEADLATPTNITSASGISLAANQHVITDSGTVTTVTNQLTAAAIATGLWQDATAGDFTVASSIGKSLYTGNVVPGGTNGMFIAGTNAATSITSALTANITGNLSGSVGSVTGAVGSVTAAVTVGTNNDKTGYGLSAAAVQAVWDALTSALTTIGSIGKLLVDNINATISSRLASASYTAPDNASIASIKISTDKLTFTVANQVDANIQSVNDTTVNGNGSPGTEWGP